MSTQVLITGGRDYYDLKTVFTTLTCLRREEPLKGLIVGDAYGADAIARLWASSTNLSHIVSYADWDKYGKGAGPKRNEFMVSLLDDTDLVIAFPGGAGTRNCANIARARGIQVDDLFEFPRDVPCTHVFQQYPLSRTFHCLICGLKSETPQ